MRTLFLSRPGLVRAALALALAGLAVTTHPAAAPADLFFSEYVEGSSNNKALEIYNGTGTAINLAAAGYNVQMHFNGNPAAGLTINLAGSVAPGDVFVLAHSAAAATILAQADQTNGAGWFNGDDAVVLRKGTTVLDVIGQIGVDPGAEWGSGLSSTADNTLRRRAIVCDGETDGSDAFAPALQWDGFATNADDGLGQHVASCAVVEDTPPAVSSTVPATGAGGVTPGVTISVTFSEPVTVSGSWFTLACSISGPVVASTAGGPVTYTIDPAAALVPGESCTLTVHAAQVADEDALDPPDAMTEDSVTVFSVADPCAAPVTPAFVIQSAGPATTLSGAVLTTRGIVVGDYEGPSPALRGFYVQDPTGDGNDLTSDGLFVFNGNRDDVNLGDLVVVTGTVLEFQGQTQVSASSVAACGTGSVAPVDVTLPAPDAGHLERFEGMLVHLPQALVVTEHFQLGRFGQIVVSSGGRLEQPTDIALPGAAAVAVQAANDLNRLVIDDGLNNQNPDPIVFGRNGQPLTAANTLRAGDTATGTVGVMTFTWAGNGASGNAYRVRPVGALGGAVSFEAANPRPAGAPERAGSLRVASFNVLNFFNTFTGCTGGAGGAPMGCRGAGNAAEFDRQWPKTVDAIVGSNADVVGIMEIENDGYGPDSALAFLVDRLNDATAPGTYDFVDVDTAAGRVNALGTDAIKVGVIYKPFAAVVIGQPAALDTIDFVNGGDGAPRNRPSLAVAFEEFATGGRFVVNVNHFKSKGSACDLPDQGDGQGACNAVRTQASDRLATWLASDPTGAGVEDVLVIGDLNAYGKEDPVSLLTASGFTDLVPEFAGGPSYVFDGQWGSLDHALASDALRDHVAGAFDWAINADEPSVLDYQTDFKSAGQVVSLYAPDRFRMSDHNVLLVDLALPSPAEGGLRVAGAAHLTLMGSAGTLTGDPGSRAHLALHARVKKDKKDEKDGATGALHGQATVFFHRTEPDGVHLYRVRTETLSTLTGDQSQEQATVIGPAEIRDLTRRSRPGRVERNAWMRISVDDNGTPGRFRDTVAITVVDSAGSLVFSNRWDGQQTVAQTVDAGNIQVR